MTSPTLAPQELSPEELPEPPCAPHLVEELLRQLARSIKTHQLYLPNNPIYQRAIENLRAAFAPIWPHTPEIVLSITEADFRWFGRSVMHESNRSESVPWVFFKDGVRELTLTQGIEDDELVSLLRILQRVRNAAPEEDDLLTLLWEQEFTRLKYRFVDINLDSHASFDASTEPPKERTLPIVDDIRAEEEAPQPERKSGIVNLSDLDATLYFLDEKEIDYLRSAVAAEADDRHAEERAGDSSGHFRGAGERKGTRGDLRHPRELHAQPARGRCVRIGRVSAGGVRDGDRSRGGAHPRAQAATARLADEPQRSVGTVRSCSRRSISPMPFRSRRSSTRCSISCAAVCLVPCSDWLKQAQKPELRTALERVAARMASSNSGEMMKLIGSSDPSVAIEAMRRAGELKTAAAVAPLAKVLQKPNVMLRQAAAQTLSEIGSAGALRLLETALNDDDRDVRIAAVKAIGVRGHRAALPRVEAVVRGKAVKGADLTEKMAYFEAYGALARDAGITPLNKLLNQRSFWGRRATPELRACAARALGIIGSPDALEALRRATGDRDPMVRSAINRAMREKT